MDLRRLLPRVILGGLEEIYLHCIRRCSKFSTRLRVQQSTWHPAVMILSCGYLTYLRRNKFREDKEDAHGPARHPAPLL